MTECCEIGTHECQEFAFTCECCGHTVWVDKCIADEIRKLHDYGVSTLGCCCGHGVSDGYIQVVPEHVVTMEELGYEKITPTVIDGCEYGSWCFTPKSEFKAVKR